MGVRAQSSIGLLATVATNQLLDIVLRDGEQKEKPNNTMGQNEGARAEFGELSLDTASPDVVSYTVWRG